MFRQILCRSNLVAQAAIYCKLSPRYVNPSNLFASYVVNDIVNGSNKKFCTSFTHNYAQPNHSPVEQPLGTNFPYLPFTKFGDQRRPPSALRSYDAPFVLNKYEARLKYGLESTHTPWDNPTSLVSPVVQVFSIHINTDFDQEIERPCEIYGSIRGIEEKGCTFSLYNRDPADPELILKQGNLSLTDSSHRSFITCSVGATTKLELLLKDKSHGIEIINGQHVLFSRNCEIEESCDRLRKAIIQGQHGFASVYYTIFRFAVIGTVTVDIKKHDARTPMDDIYGSIVAVYRDSRRYCSNEGDLNYLKTTLFSKPFKNSLRTTDTDPIPLSRYVLAVPAYSYLRIEVDLWDSLGPFARGSADFTARDLGDITESVEGEGGVISVQVSWESAFSRLWEEKNAGDNSEIRGVQVITPCKGGDSEKKGVISDARQQVTSAFDPFRSIYPTVSVSSGRGKSMLELFSIYVCGTNHKVSTLCGRILLTINSRLRRLKIYEKDLSNPEFLTTYKSIIPVECHSPLRHGRMSLCVGFKDPVRNLEVCNGDMGWGPSSVYCKELYDKRLCSVVRGLQGYAAVHYMVLKEACPAIVEITISFNDVAFADVYGCIFARYGNHDYSTAYEKKFYSSRLFDKPEGKSTQLKTCSKLPLLKSVVAVPVDDSLIIEADLRAFSVEDPTVKALCGKTMFEVGSSSNFRKKIQGFHYCLDVMVNFVWKT